MCLYFPPYNTKSFFFFFLHFHSLHLSIQKQCIATNWKKDKKWQGSVTSVWCHSWVLWQSPDTPDISCFYVSARLRVRSLICSALFRVGAWCSDPSTPVLSYGSCRGSDTSCSMFCLSLGACGLEFAQPYALLSTFVVFCDVARSSCFIGCMHSCYMLCCVPCVFHRLHAFMLSCLVWTCRLWIFSLAACSCPVLHMAGDLFCWPWACVFVLCEHMTFFLVLSVPCALMLIVMTTPILFPDYWLICPTCLPLLPSSFAPFIISLCLQSCASLSSNVSCSCLALPCLVLPCLALPCLALPCLALPCLALPCLALVSPSPAPLNPSLIPSSTTLTKSALKSLYKYCINSYLFSKCKIHLCIFFFLTFWFWIKIT